MAYVPFIGCFVFTFRFISPSPDDRGTESNVTGLKLLYSLLIASIWLFLFFFDGQSVSCMFSHWRGVYTETDSMKWCKPTGNEAALLEIQQETRRLITVPRVSSEIYTAKCFHQYTLKQCVLTR